MKILVPMVEKMLPNDMDTSLINLKNILVSFTFAVAAFTARAQKLSHPEVDSLMKEVRKLVTPGDKVPSDPEKYFVLVQSCAANEQPDAMYRLAEW